MEIHKVSGCELKKGTSTSSEGFFNRSEVVLVINGEEKTLSVVYLRYFEEKLAELTPFKDEPLYTFLEYTFSFKELVALFYLLKDPALAERKRVYVHDLASFKKQLQGIHYQKIPVILQSVISQGKYNLEKPQEFLK